MSILMLLDLCYLYKSQVMTESRSIFTMVGQVIHYVCNLYVFAPDDTIPACSLDTPGSHHDSRVTGFGSLYTLLTDMYGCNEGKSVLDSAFARADNDCVIYSGQVVHVRMYQY